MDVANRQYDEAKASGARPWTTVYFGANSELGRRLMELSAKSGMSINKLCRCLVESAIDRVEIKTERRTVITKKLVIDGREFE